MYPALTDDELRDRLQTLFEERHGPIARDSLRRFAVSAGVQYTTLARYFGMYGIEQQTKRLQYGTIKAVLQGLGVNDLPLDGEMGDRQLDLWPVIVRSEPLLESGSDPIGKLEEALRQIREYPQFAQVHASRAAISALLASLADTGQLAPPAAYDCLRQLDEMRRVTRHLRAV
jgi:hypothetical protein